jgi:amidase
MADVIQFNEEHAARVMPYFGQEHLISAQQKGPLTEKKYRDALARNRRLTRAAGIDAAMRSTGWMLSSCRRADRPGSLIW